MKLREGQPDTADTCISLLAKLYHYFLLRQEELVPLREELAALDTLHQLLLHTGKHLHISRELKDPEICLAVPISLVRLVEAIAHSQLTSEAAPLQLLLLQEAGQLQLRFQPNFSFTRQHRFEQGFQSLQQQYAWLRDKPVLLTTGSDYQIRIPTSTMELHESHHH